jgi:hypothetical protein
MVCFQTKIPYLGKFWRALDWKMFIYFTAIWYILWRFGIFYDHLVHLVFIWYFFSGFGVTYQEKSGNPALVIFFTQIVFFSYRGLINLNLSISIQLFNLVQKNCLIHSQKINSYIWRDKNRHRILSKHTYISIKD